MKSSKLRAKSLILNGMRIVLLIVLAYALWRQRQLVAIVSVIGIVFTFFPFLSKRLFRTEVPAVFDATLLLFIYGLIYYADLHGTFGDSILSIVLLPLFSALIFGAIGMSIVSVLNSEDRIKANPTVLAIIAFSCAFAIGALWEVFEFILDSLLGFSLQSGLSETMVELIIIAIGSLIVSLIGFRFIRQGKPFLVSSLVADRLKSKTYSVRGKPEIVHDLIKQGESKRLEFKSTLRTNLHTNQHDSAVEHASLKTLAAYMNSDGGTLLIGVNDKGEITGIDRDNFPDNDKYSLHLTNLIKQHIGPEFLPFIEHDIIDLGDKKIVKVDCKPSAKEVFFKHGKEENFYVRNGPATMQLNGSALLDYIDNKFRS